MIFITYFNQKILIFFLISPQNHYRYSLEAPCQGASNKYQQHDFCGGIKKKKNYLDIPFIWNYVHIWVLFDCLDNP